MLVYHPAKFMIVMWLIKEKAKPKKIILNDIELMNSYLFVYRFAIFWLS